MCDFSDLAKLVLIVEASAIFIALDILLARFLIRLYWSKS